MKVMLLFPPKWDITCPYASLPSLTAFLKQNNCEVIQRDINIETYDTLLSKEKLQKIYERFRNMNDDQKAPGDILEIIKDTKNIKGIELKDFDMDSNESLLNIEESIEHIEEAKAIMRNQADFYNPDKYYYASKIIKQAQDLIQCLIQNCDDEPESNLNGVLLKNILQSPFLEFFEQEIVPSIISEKSNLIGISVVSDPQLIPAFALAFLLKKKSQVHIVMGGPAITYKFNEILKNKKLFSFVDSFVIGEGESALLELAKQIEGEGDLSKVPNLVYCQDNELKVNKPFTKEDLNKLPTPCFDGFPLEKYFSPYPVLPLFTSRKCYWGRCAFCSMFKYDNNPHSKVCSLRSAEKVIEDIKNLSNKYNAKYFNFYDAAVSPAMLERISKLIIQENLNLAWYCFARFEKAFTKELCNLFAKAGCKNLRFGLESASSRILNLMDKGTNKQEIKQILKNCYNAKISISLSCITGFPSETKEEALETLNFILENKNIIQPYFSGGFNQFHIEEYSKVYDNPECYGIKIENKDKSEFLNKHYHYTARAGLTMEEAAKLTYELRKCLHDGLKETGFFLNSLDARSHLLFYANYYRLEQQQKIIDINNQILFSREKEIV